MKSSTAFLGALLLSGASALAFAQTQAPPASGDQQGGDAKAKCEQEAKDQQLSGDAAAQYVKECVKKAKGGGY
jgi:hypothetical protein